MNCDDVFSDEEEFSNTPPDLKKCVQNAVMDKLLPEKSKEIYNKHFSNFLRWHQQEKIKENYFTENVLIAYFVSLFPVYKASSLFSILSAIKSSLLAFYSVTLEDLDNLDRLQTMLKQKQRVEQKKQSKTFEREEVEKFLKEAPNEKYINIKFALLISLFGATRRSELALLNMDNISVYSDHLIIQTLVVKNSSRKFYVPKDDEEYKNALFYFNYILERRPKVQKCERVFLKLNKDGKFVNQPIGKNTIAKYPKLIAEFLSLPNPESYTGHAFRRTAATWLANAGVDMLNLKRFGGWHSDTIAESYIAESHFNKRKLANMVSGAEENQESKRSKIEEFEANEKKKIENFVNLSDFPISFSGLSNCTFNINICK